MKKVLLVGILVLSSLSVYTQNTKSGQMVFFNSKTINKLPTATCFCKLTCDDLTNKKSATNVFMDLTGEVGKTYSGLNPQNDNNQTDCNTRCTTAAAKYTGNQGVAAMACPTCPNGGVVRAWSAVGTREYKSAQQIGVLVNKPEVKQTTCTCPKGWVSNGTNQTDGGVTYEGPKSCKKMACQAINILPLPTNGTQLGDWGFTWGNALYAWGTPQNGGGSKCITNIISPAICRFQ